MVSAVIAAGGKGSRMGADKNKVYLKLCGIEMLLYTVTAFNLNSSIDEIIVVTGEGDIERCRNLLKSCDKVSAVTEGGNTRQQSVYNGISKASGDIILIHDGARALISQKEITSVIEDCAKYGAAAVGVKVKDTLKLAENGFITGTADRENTYQIQTPQAFKADIIKRAHKNAINNGFDFTDDCRAAEEIGVKIKITEGSYENIKITTPEDMVIAEGIISKNRRKEYMRIGQGYDVHRLTEGRDLILCGVKIPYEKGLLGHSDADVALHALSDAILGAAALGDIGRHFPDTDDRYKGADSRVLLREIVRMVRDKGFEIENADVTIAAQKPKLAGYIDKMRDNIAKDLEISKDCVNVKATTTERLGFEGRGEGISSTAVVLLK